MMTQTQMDELHKHQCGLMTWEQIAVEVMMNCLGYETLWAYRKGGGFWVRGLGYCTLRHCCIIIKNAEVE